MVNFSTPASATAAIQALNGYPLEDGAGKTLIVRQAARDMARTPIQTVSVSLPQRTPIAPIGLPTQGIPTNLWIGVWGWVGQGQRGVRGRFWEYQGTGSSVSETGLRFSLYVPCGLRTVLSGGLSLCTAWDNVLLRTVTACVTVIDLVLDICT